MPFNNLFPIKWRARGQGKVGANGSFAVAANAVTAGSSRGDGFTAAAGGVNGEFTVTFAPYGYQLESCVLTWEGTALDNVQCDIKSYSAGVLTIRLKDTQAAAALVAGAAGRVHFVAVFADMSF
jgi:hypothetical protein